MDCTKKTAHTQYLLSMANLEEEQPSWDVCEAGPSGLVAPLDPIHVEEEEGESKGAENKERGS